MRIRLIFSSAVLLMSSVAAHAGIITSLASAPTAVNGGYAYTYDVSLTGQLDAAGAGVSTQFGTLYDFGTILLNPDSHLYSATGYLSTSFSFAFSAVSTPAAYQTVPTDNPSLTNVRFLYTGSVNYVDSGSATTLAPGTYTTLADGINNLGTFTLISPYGPTTTYASFDGQDYKGANNTLEGNVGLAAVPNPVPEPSTLALLGTGMLGMVGLVRRRLRS